MYLWKMKYLQKGTFKTILLKDLFDAYLSTGSQTLVSATLRFKLL